VLILCFAAQANSSVPLYFGPLTTRMRPGLPRHSMTLSRLRIARSVSREKSTSIPNPSRLKSCSTFNSQKGRPSPSLSAMKSIDHTRSGASGTPRASGISRRSRLQGLIHVYLNPRAIHHQSILTLSNVHDLETLIQTLDRREILINMNRYGVLCSAGFKPPLDFIDRI
jgi:hypothetical protein